MATRATCHDDTPASTRYGDSLAGDVPPPALPLVIPLKPVPVYLSDEWVAALDRLLVAASAPGDGPPLVVQYEVSDAPAGDRAWYLRLQPGEVRALPGRAASPDVTFSQRWIVAVAITRGERAAPEALLSGDVQVSGDPTALLPWHEALRQVEAALSTLCAELSSDLPAGTELVDRQG